MTFTTKRTITPKRLALAWLAYVVFSLVLWFIPPKATVREFVLVAVSTCVSCVGMSGCLLKSMNLPTNLPKTTNTLYLGIGGGFDYLGAIPIHEAIKSNAVFAGIGTDSTSYNLLSYPFRAIKPDGAYHLASSLLDIVDMHNIDTIIAVDGGVDCLMHGDEQDSGTVLQDFVTLAALDNLLDITAINVVVACVGFGCETEENLNHYAALENIATLVRDDAFYGSCSLVSNTPEFAKYKAAVEHKDNSRKSHIQTRVIAAVEGRFGNVSLGEDANLSATIFDVPNPPFVSPLMSIYWFFHFAGVSDRNHLIQALKSCRTMTESFKCLSKGRSSKKGEESHSVMKKLTKQQKIVEKMVLLLLTLKHNKYEPDRTYSIVANEAADMAYRANRAKKDHTWWEVCGRPDFNRLMKRLRKKIE